MPLPLTLKMLCVYYYSFVVDPQSFDMDRVTGVIQRHIPDAKVGHQHAAEISYTLPYKDVGRFSGTKKHSMYIHTFHLYILLFFAKLH